MAQVARRGVAIYEARLKSLLEPQHAGEGLAVHVDTGDDAVAPNKSAALRKLPETHATGQLVLMQIGGEPEYGLIARLGDDLRSLRRRP